VPRGLFAARSPGAPPRLSGGAGSSRRAARAPRFRASRVFRGARPGRAPGRNPPSFWGPGRGRPPLIRAKGSCSPPQRSGRLTMLSEGSRTRGDAREGGGGRGLHLSAIEAVC